MQIKGIRKKQRNKERNKQTNKVVKEQRKKQSSKGTNALYTSLTFSLLCHSAMRTFLLEDYGALFLHSSHDIFPQYTHEKILKLEKITMIRYKCRDTVQYASITP